MESSVVFRWLQPFAVHVEGIEGMAPGVSRPVLAVQEEGQVDPWRVRVLFIVPDDNGQLKRVPIDQTTIGGVGSWSQLMMLSERQSPAARAAQAGLSLPQTAPANLRRQG